MKNRTLPTSPAMGLISPEPSIRLLLRRGTLSSLPSTASTHRNHLNMLHTERVWGISNMITGCT